MIAARAPVMLVLAATVALSPAGCRRKAAAPKVVVNGHTFSVEIADDRASRRRGLSRRPSLAADKAMLFVFRSAADRTFHMKECYFPIDIAFLDEDRKIINLATMAVEPDPANPVKLYESDAPAMYVLEVAGGAWERIGAEPGMEIEFVDVFSRR